jgi:hypothetical protein
MPIILVYFPEERIRQLHIIYVLYLSNIVVIASSTYLN